MKLQFKHQPFQAEAAAAVCDVFNGQPYRTVTYRRDLGDTAGQQLSMEDSEVGFRNQPFIPEVTNRRILDNLRAVQRRNGLRPSDELTGPGVNMLPIEIMGYVEYHFDPTIAALATIMMVATLGVMLLIEKTLGLQSVV